MAANNVAMWFLKRDWESWKYEIRMITRQMIASAFAPPPILLALLSLPAY
jgi:hypothetical protein